MVHFSIPLYYKYGIYASSCLLIYYVYEKFDFKSTNLNKIFNDFSVLKNINPLWEKLDTLFDTKGKQEAKLVSESWITSKNGLGDYFRNKAKTHELKIFPNGILKYYTSKIGTSGLREDVIIWQYDITKKGSGEFVLYLDPSDNILKVFERTGHDITGVWKQIYKVINTPIDYLENTDDGNLIAHYKNKIVWKNGVVMNVIEPNECDDEDNPEIIIQNPIIPIITIEETQPATNVIDLSEPSILDFGKFET